MFIFAKSDPSWLTMDQNYESLSSRVVKRIGYWVTERKYRRLNFETLEKVCRYDIMCRSEVAAGKMRMCGGGDVRIFEVVKCGC